MNPNLLLWPIVIHGLATLLVYLPMSRIRRRLVREGKTKAGTFRLLDGEPEESRKFSNAIRNQNETGLDLLCRPAGCLPVAERDAAADRSCLAVPGTETRPCHGSGNRQQAALPHAAVHDGLYRAAALLAGADRQPCRADLTARRCVSGAGRAPPLKSWPQSKRAIARRPTHCAIGVSPTASPVRPTAPPSAISSSIRCARNPRGPGASAPICPNCWFGDTA